MEDKYSWEGIRLGGSATKGCARLGTMAVADREQDGAEGLGARLI
jgi:hypothetical protein